MKEYMIICDGGIEFGVYAVSENEAKEVAEDILSTTMVISVEEL